MIKTFFANLFLNNLSQGLQFGSRWLFTIFLIKLLSVEDFATFSFVYSVSNILIALFTYGNGVFLINEADETLEAKDKLAQSLNMAVLLFAPIFLFSILLCFFKSSFSPEIPLLPLGIFLGLIFSINTCLFGFLKGLNNFIIETKIYSISSILIVLFIAYLYIDLLSLKAIFIILILINSLITVLILVLTKVISLDLLLKNFKFSILKNALRSRIYFGLQEITTASYSQGGMIIIYYLVSNTVYGQYRAMLTFISPFSLFNVAFSQVILSHLKKTSKETALKTLLKYQAPIALLLILFLAGMYFYGGEIVHWITNLDIQVPEINTIYIFSLFIIISGFIYGGLEMLLVRLDMQKFRFLAMLIGAVINLLSIFFLLPEYGLIGAMATNLLAYISVLISIVLIIYLKTKK